MELTDTQRRINAMCRATVKAAEWVAAQPWPDDVTVRIIGVPYGDPIVDVDVMDLGALREVRRLAGAVKRRGGGEPMYLTGEVDGIYVIVHLPAETCERVQVGTKEVPVYETRCPESVLALTDDTEAVEVSA